jgi:hypothetical protein
VASQRLLFLALFVCVCVSVTAPSALASRLYVRPISPNGTTMANELQQRAFNASIGNAWIDALIMAATNALFFIDLGLSTLTGLPTITILLQPYQQYTVGVLAIFCVAIVLGLFVVDRYFANNSYKLNGQVQIAFGALACFVMGFGGFFFGLTQSVIVITLCFFLPPMVAVTAVAYQIYAANGYALFKPAEQRTPSMVPFFSGLFHRGLPASDYAMVVLLSLDAILLTGMGLTISAYHPMTWLGWTIALSMLILFSTAFSIFEYRQNLELTPHLMVQASVSFVAFLAMVITLYVSGALSESEMRGGNHHLHIAVITNFFHHQAQCTQDAHLVFQALFAVPLYRSPILVSH